MLAASLGTTDMTRKVKGALASPLFRQITIGASSPLAHARS